MYIDPDTNIELEYRIDNWHIVPENKYKESIYVYGPAYLHFNAHSDFKTFWKNGSSEEVYKQRYGVLEGGHAVLVIGWDDNKKAWLCKNSWGENEGPNGDGTFWLAYFDHVEEIGFIMTNFSITKSHLDDLYGCFIHLVNYENDIYYPNNKEILR